jgi:hypothetical protein
MFLKPQMCNCGLIRVFFRVCCPFHDAQSAWSDAAARNDDDDEVDDEFDTRSRGSSHRSEVWAFGGLGF